MNIKKVSKYFFFTVAISFVACNSPKKQITSKNKSVLSPKEQKSVVAKTPEELALAEINKIENSQSIVWLSPQKAETLSKYKRKKIILDLYTDWCHCCKELDKRTYTDAAVIKEINTNYYAVKFDAESKEALSFNGQSHSNIGGYNSYAMQYLGKSASFPSTVFVDNDSTFTHLSTVPGFWPADQFIDILTYFSGNHYDNMKFEEYKSREKK